MAITKASAQTTVNSGVNAAAAATVNEITTAPSTATVVAGGGTLGGVTISNVAITDSTFANVLSGDTAVSSAGGFVRITGTGFKTNANVFLGSTVLANTFVDSTRINANIPASAAGTYQFTVFNTDGSGAISPAGLLISGPPSWTTTSYTSGSLTLGIQLLASGDAPLTYYIQPGSANPQNLAVNSAGYLSGTVSAEGSYTVTVVVDDAQGQSTQADITTTISLTDPYFNITTLALPADSNYWIRDASTNKFAGTLQADLKPLAFSPYKTVWSNSFDGTGDYLTLPSSSAFSFGTGDFTVEGWYYLNAGVTRFCLYDSGGGGTNGQLSIFQDSASGFFVRMSSDVTYASPPGTNQWTHFAVTRSGTTVRLFFNGSLATSGTQATDITNTTPYIGYLNGFGSYIMNGYISNLRVLKGTALYTGAFTPSTTPLTAVAGTSLLTCQSNRLIDNSTNNFTITKNGDTTVSAFGPFTETDTTTGSGYLDGTGDRLEFANDVALQMGTGDFTIEAWVYSTASQGANSGIIAKGGSSTGFTINVTGTTVFVSITNGTANITSTAGAVPLNAWTHVAFVRSGTTIYLFVNGVQVDSGTSAADLTETNVLRIGANRTNGAQFGGYIADVRVIKGTALYTAAFTPPSSSLTAVANTQLLTLQYPIGETNSRFVDNSGWNHILTRDGNATQGTFSPFSPTGWSNYFDGTGDYFDLPSNAAFTLGTGDFTIEGWMYINSGTTGTLYDSRTGTTSVSPVIYLNSGVLTYFVAANRITGPTLAFNTWYHIAVSKSSNSTKMFVDGSQVGSTYTDANDYVIGGPKVGAGYNNVNLLNGYISNLRVIKGTALYTTAFTPSTTPLTAVAGTSLLTCQSNRLRDASTNNFTITKSGDVSVQAFSPFAPGIVYSAATHGGSMYSDGTGDALSLAGSTAFDFGTGNFTLECFFYVTTVAGITQVIFDAWNNSPTRFLVRINSGTLEAYTTYGSISGSAVTINQWNHVAFVRNGSTTTLYLNGVSVGTPISSAAGITASTALWTISRANETFNGYLASLRVVKGTAVYTSAFTPPTAPLSAIVGTSLLCNFTNGGITDVTAKTASETIGDAQLTTAQSKYGGSSMSFDGTGDNIRFQYQPIYDFGTGDFTIECWVYFNALTSNRLLIDRWATANANSWQLYWRSTGTSMTFLVGASTVLLQDSNASRIVTGQWYHIAVTRSGTTNRLFVDGTIVATATDSTSLTSTLPINLGNQLTTSTNYLNGYLDDVRITRGYARYTANFTPPTATFKLR